MKTPIPAIDCRLAVATVLLCGSAVAVAQVKDAEDAPGEEEVEFIVIGGEPDEVDGVYGDPDGYRLVEDDEEETWVEPPSERELNEDEVVRMFQLFREALNNNAYAEADTLAKQIIELSIKLHGRDSNESAMALTNLAIAQHNNRDFESAQTNYEAAIEIIETVEDRLNHRLINPLKGLAAAQMEAGRPDLARESFRRAVHISHVNEGPHNLMQVEMLESMAEIYLSVGEYDQAIDAQERIYGLQARNLDQGSMDMLPALERQAYWQHRLQMYHKERVTWRRAISIIERNRGKESLQLIQPLTSLGKSYLFVTPVEYDYQPEVSVASGESYLKRAKRIAEKNPSADWETFENTLLALGDYYVLSGRPNRAERVYQEAWEFLTDDPAKLENRREHLEKLNVLQNISPPKYHNSQRTEDGRPVPENFATGTVTFGFTVLPSGKISNIKHVGTTPAGLVEMSKSVGRNLRYLVYRPRMQEASLVATNDVTYTHEFYYRPSDVPEPEQAEPEAAEPEPEAEVVAEQNGSEQ